MRVGYWVKVGEIGWGELESLLDPSAPLWANCDSTFNGVNDRVGAEAASGLDHSLRFIRVERLSVQVHVEGTAFGNPKRKVRAGFNHHGANYCLVVTDPVSERAFLGRPDGVHHLRDAYLCVSLSEMYRGACYKPVATIFTEGPF
jgi:hypothetical protein